MRFCTYTSANGRDGSCFATPARCRSADQRDRAGAARIRKRAVPAEDFVHDASIPLLEALPAKRIDVCALGIRPNLAPACTLE